MITNNAGAATTSTYAFVGNQTSYNLYAALNDGSGGGKVALTSNIATTVIGGGYTLHAHATSTYSGGTTVFGENIEADATNGFWNRSHHHRSNNASVNNSFLQVIGGISLSNNITLAQPNPGAGLGAINYLTSSSGSTTLTGTINASSRARAVAATSMCQALYAA